jgi:hypothetical protein
MAPSRSTALTAALLFVGLSLVVVPLLVPPDVPDDRVAYAVEADWSDYQNHPNRAYGNLSADARAVFDAARTNGSGRVNVSYGDAPEAIRPPREGIDVWDVRYEGSYYLLEGRHLTYEADFGTQILPRAAAVACGAVLALVGAFRTVVR